MSLESDPSFDKRQSLAVLAGEILRDTQKLFDQQVALTKQELVGDCSRAKPFAFWLTGGLVALFGACVLLALTLVFLLKEFTELPLWICFGLVGVVFLLVAVISLYVARFKLKGISVLNG